MESRKKDALAPLAPIKKDTESKLREANEILTDAKNKESEIEDLSEKLQDKLDELGQKEQDLIKDRQKLDLERQGLDQQVTNTKAGVKQLSLEIKNFAMVRDQAEKQINDRKTAVSLLESSILSKDSLLKKKELDLTTWAVNIQTASFELDQKRKQALVPVESLKTEAKKLKDQAQINLDEAQQYRNEAVALQNQAQVDYAAKLRSLDDREENLTLDELKLKELTTKVHDRDRVISDRETNFASSQSQLNLDRKYLENDRKNFEQDREKAFKVIELKKIEAEAKEQNALLILAKAEKTKQDTEILVRDLKQHKIEIKSSQEELEKSKGLLAAFETKTLGLKDETTQAVLSLRQEKETFAIWRTEAENFVEDKAVENTKKQQLLDTQEGKLKHQEKFLADWAIRLKDERGTLDRAWKELEKKQNIRIEK